MSRKRRVAFWSGLPTADVRLRAEKPLPNPRADARTYVTDPCPACGAPTKVREARRSRRQFIGCTAFPRCSRTSPLVT